MSNTKKLFVLFILLLLAVEVVTLKPYITGEKVQNYKGDEVWYVDAARNYLHNKGINVYYKHEVEYTQNGKLYKVINYGANIVVRAPDQLDPKEVQERIVSGDPNDVYNLIPDIYNFDNYGKYVNDLFTQANATGMTRVLGVHPNAKNIGYFFFPNNQMIDNVQKVAENYTAPENVIVTLTYQVPVQGDNGQITYATKTLKYMAFKKGEKMFDVVPGFWYGNQWGIEKYMNLEHPFFGKLFIIGEMRVFGDNPTYWRIIPLIMYLTMIVIVALAVLELTGSYFWASVGALLIGIDPGLRMLGATAMLDIFVAFFSALALLAFARKHLLWASFWTGMAFAVKFNGGFMALGIGIYLLYKVMEMNADTKKKTIEFVKYGSLYTGVFALAFFIANVPILHFVSLHEWWNGLVQSLYWHLSWKGPHPFQSPIWNWFFNRNPFTIYADPRIMIQTNWFLWDMAALFSILFFLVPKIFPRKEKRTGFALVNLGVWSIVIMYLTMYVLGGKSQYSYYSVQLTPYWIVIFTTILAYFIDWNRFKGTFFYETIIPAFTGKASVPKEKKIEKIEEKALGDIPEL